MTKKVIIYARTACQTQVDNESQIGNQIRACKRLAKKLGFNVAGTVFQEEVNGMDNSDQRLLLNFCQEKRAKTFIVYGMDRISRNYADCIRFIFLLKTEGIDLLTVKSGSDWILETFVKRYKTELSRAIKRGIKEAKK